MAASLEWNELDSQAVDIARVLAADAVEKVGNGHPGTAISLAPAAYLLYQKVMNGDPADPHWLGRDRFVLSAGHSSLTQYIQLFMAGYGLELDDLKALRTEDALTPGHPEYGLTAGVECTTGPLGAGIAVGVGFAMAARRERAMLDPDNTATSVFDRFVYVLAGDGCMQEGVAAEAASLAGTQKLGNLILIYDDNRITIEGDTAITFTEDVLARHAAYGWHTQHVDWTHGGTTYQEDVQQLFAAITAAQQETERPSIIRLSTVIGWPLANLAGDSAVHGAKLGGEEVASLKQRLGFDPAETFAVADGILQYTRANAAKRAVAAKAAWQPKVAAWEAANPKPFQLYERLAANQLPEGFEDVLPVFEPGKKSTRAASGAVLNALADVLPELWGGSADLAGSNNTSIKDAGSFMPAGSDFGDPSGRIIHFGVREHAMGNILNAIAISGLTRAYGGTFLVFADYMRGAVRLAALQKCPSIFIWSHDSIGVGEDGPTHQPIEHLVTLRAIPGLDVIRPADANETVQAWAQIIKNQDRPVALILSRQDLPVFERGAQACADAENVAKGGYVLKEASATPQVVLLATGSEVAIGIEAQTLLEAEGIPTRVVSLPCLEWFAVQPAEYRLATIPANPVKVSIEAGSSLGWREYVGDRGEVIGLDHFGESVSGARLFEKYGFTAENVAQRAKSALIRG
ncbi:MAG: transketolase [Propionibacteriaceae bacterium]|nr:transketolase [Propionibacteriaceae bacterium]